MSLNTEVQQTDVTSNRTADYGVAVGSLENLRQTMDNVTKHVIILRSQIVKMALNCQIVFSLKSITVFKKTSTLFGGGFRLRG